MMALSIAHFGALAANLLMGFLVSIRNIRRTANQFFFLLSLVAGVWLTFLSLAFTNLDAPGVIVCIRGSTATAITAPFVFNGMRLSIIHQDESFWQILIRGKNWLFVTLAAAWLCNTSFFLRDVIMPAPDAPGHLIPEPVHGPGVYLYAATFVVMVFVLMVLYIRDIRRSTGIRRTELQFITMGSVVGLVVGVFVAVILPLFTGSSQTVQFSFLSILVLDAVIAYGIATRRIMEAGYVLRLAVAHALAVLYLSALYAAVYFLVRSISSFYQIDTNTPAHLLAAIAVAFSLTPARGRIRRFSDLLFFNSRPPPDIGVILRRAERLMQSISALDQLFRDFSGLLIDVLQTGRVVVLMREDGRFVRQYASDTSAPPAFLPADDLLPKSLEEEDQPLVLDLMLRFRPHPRITALRARMEELGAAAAAGIRSKGSLRGLILLGPREDGRIYGMIEQQAMQLICNQMPIAIENAQLVAALKAANSYNETLLDQLVSGVAAADASGRITVFNREAQRITGLRAGDVMQQPLSVLPRPLADLMAGTLRGGESVQDRDLDLVGDAGERVPVRAGSSVFRDAAGAMMGVLLVFHDQTAIRKLETQVRRTDRLASLGTLSAGMAHEIKNPLVTLKTFTDLLPTRYEDSDFRETFTSLAGREVRRIDALVNQLLHFARPAPAQLKRMRLRPVLTDALNLVSEKMRQGSIRWETDWQAGADEIMGDAGLLEQAFVNLFLNALAAMPENGVMTVRTKSAPGARVRVTVADTGEGIAPEHLPQVFDPFFTTKSEGTGLGLSVCHGIVIEHGAQIDVESEQGKGTAFHVLFPLADGEKVS